MSTSPSERSRCSHAERFSVDATRRCSTTFGAGWTRHAGRTTGRAGSRWGSARGSRRWRSGYDWRAARRARTAGAVRRRRRALHRRGRRAAAVAPARLAEQRVGVPPDRPAVRVRARVVVPSLPGYGFSAAAGRDRGDGRRVHALMGSLGSSASSSPAAIGRAASACGSRTRIPDAVAGAAPVHAAAAAASTGRSPSRSRARLWSAGSRRRAATCTSRARGHRRSPTGCTTRRSG